MKESIVMKKKVLIAVSVASMVDQFMIPNIQLLLDMGYEVHVICNFKEGNTCDAKQIHDLRKKLSRMQVILHQWDCPRSFKAVEKCWKAFVQMWKVTGQYQFAWIHCHSPIGAVLARLVSHYRKLNVIYTAHGFHFYQGAPVKNWILFYPIEKLLAYWTDGLITVNQEDYCFARNNLSAGNIYKISGVGIDSTRFRQRGDVKERLKRRMELCRAYQIPINAVILLSVGELSKRKNHQIVIDALALLAQSEVYYMICGQGELKKKLAARAKKYGMEDRIRLVGYQEAVEELYQNADIFVFPSIQEGLPVALMEAMAAGLPCVVSNVRGNRELIDDKGGIKFVPGNIEQLRNAIEIMLSDEKIRKEYGEYNQKKAEAYDWRYIRHQMKKIYQSQESVWI